MTKITWQVNGRYRTMTRRLPQRLIVPTTTDKGIVELSIGRGEAIENHEGEHKVRRSDRLKMAKRVEKLEGIEYF